MVPSIDLLKILTGISGDLPEEMRTYFYVFLFVAFSPHIWPIISESKKFFHWHQSYEKQKKILELLKLQAELEEIKKGNRLQTISIPTFPSILIDSLAGPSKRTNPIPKWKRFLWGALGSVPVIALTFYISPETDITTNLFYFIGVLTRGIVFSFVGGIVASQISREEGGVKYVIAGLSSTALFLWVLIKINGLN